MAEYIGTKTNECLALKRLTLIKEKKKISKANQIAREYSFDLTKADEIFDALIKNGQIKLSDYHVIPPPEDQAGKEYCKWHNSWIHTTNNCVIFRNVIQKAIDDGKLLFPGIGKAVMIRMMSPRIPYNMIFPKDIKVLSPKKGEPWTPDLPQVRVELKLPEEEGESSKVNREVTFTNEKEVTCPTCQHSFKYTPRKHSRSPGA